MELNRSQPRVQALDRNQEALLCCEAAKGYEAQGDYEMARRAVGAYWQRVGDRPALEGLARASQAEVLLRAGMLTGWIGSTSQIAESQQWAKDLITEALDIFSQEDNQEKVAEAMNALVVCYWREGALDEARVLAKEGLTKLNKQGSEVWVSLTVNRAMVERSARLDYEALQILKAIIPFVTDSISENLRGCFHLEYALALENTGDIDRALIENTAASFHYGNAGNRRFQARIENNLGHLFLRLDRFAEAHDHITRSIELFKELRDNGTIAQVRETQARVYLAEGRFEDAEATARLAVKTLEEGDEHAALVEALTTHGIALARLGRADESLVTLTRAYHVASVMVGAQSAAHVGGIIINELAGLLSFNAGTKMEEAVLSYEESILRNALIANQKNITKAAFMVGTSQQQLSWLLNNRHCKLREELNIPVKARRKAIIKRLDTKGKNFNKTVRAFPVKQKDTA